MATTGTARPSRPGSPSGRNWLAELSTAAKSRPSAIVIYGPPGIGKSSLAGSIPGAIAMPTPNEQTWDVLKQSGSVPSSLPVLPTPQTWLEVFDQIEAIKGNVSKYSALIVDTLGGLESMCVQHVCDTHFAGEMGEKGFASYGKGHKLCVIEWRQLLQSLDDLRTAKCMAVVALAHCGVKAFKNPVGSDYDKYAFAMDGKETANLIYGWADAVLFASFDLEVDEKKKKAKGGERRVLNTSPGAGYDAKNRFGLPPEIDMGASGQEAWANLSEAMAAAKKGGEA